MNRKKSDVNGVELEKKRRYRSLTGKIAALTALNWKIAALMTSNGRNGGVNSVEPEKKRR